MYSPLIKADKSVLRSKLNPKLSLLNVRLYSFTPLFSSRLVGPLSSSFRTLYTVHNTSPTLPVTPRPQSDRRPTSLFTPIFSLYPSRALEVPSEITLGLSVEGSKNSSLYYK